MGVKFRGSLGKGEGGRTWEGSCHSQLKRWQPESWSGWYNNRQRRSFKQQGAWNSTKFKSYNTSSRSWRAGRQTAYDRVKSDLALRWREHWATETLWAKHCAVSPIAFVKSCLSSSTRYLSELNRSLFRVIPCHCADVHSVKSRDFVIRFAFIRWCCPVFMIKQSSHVLLGNPLLSSIPGLISITLSVALLPSKLPPSTLLRFTL